MTRVTQTCTRSPFSKRRGSCGRLVKEAFLCPASPPCAQWAFFLTTLRRPAEVRRPRVFSERCHVRAQRQGLARLRVRHVCHAETWLVRKYCSYFYDVSLPCLYVFVILSPLSLPLRVSLSPLSSSFALSVWLVRTQGPQAWLSARAYDTTFHGIVSEVARDVKGRWCFIALDDNTELKSTAESSDKEKTYETPVGIITVSAQRFRCLELWYFCDYAEWRSCKNRCSVAKLARAVRPWNSRYLLNPWSAAGDFPVHLVHSLTDM